MNTVAVVLLGLAFVLYRLIDKAKAPDFKDIPLLTYRTMVIFEAINRVNADGPGCGLYTRPLLVQAALADVLLERNPGLDLDPNYPTHAFNLAGMLLKHPYAPVEMGLQMDAWEQD